MRVSKGGDVKLRQDEAVNGKLRDEQEKAKELKKK